MANNNDDDQSSVIVGSSTHNELLNDYGEMFILVYFVYLLKHLEH